MFYSVCQYYGGHCTLTAVYLMHEINIFVTSEVQQCTSILMLNQETCNIRHNVNVPSMKNYES